MDMVKLIGFWLVAAVVGIGLLLGIVAIGDMTIGRIGLSRGKVEFHESLRKEGQSQALVVAFHGMGSNWEQSKIFEQVWHEAGADVLRIGTPGEIYDQDTITTKTADEVVRRLSKQESYRTIVYDGTSMGGQAARLTGQKARQRIEELDRDIRMTFILDNSPYGNSTLVTKDRDNIPKLRFYPFGRLANALRFHEYLDKDTNIEVASLWESQMLAFSLPKPAAGEMDYADQVVFIKARNDTETVRVEDAANAWKLAAPQIEYIELPTKHVSFTDPDEQPLHIDGRRMAINMVLR